MEDDPCKENESCLVDYKSNTQFCKCIGGNWRPGGPSYLDTQTYPKHYYQDDSSTDGVYWVYPDEEEPFQVLCDMKTDVGGWTGSGYIALHAFR